MLSNSFLAWMDVKGVSGEQVLSEGPLRPSTEVQLVSWGREQPISGMPHMPVFQTYALSITTFISITIFMCLHVFRNVKAFSCVVLNAAVCACNPCSSIF